MKRNRILNANNYLTAFLKENDHFFVGILFEDFIQSANLEKYGLPKVFRNNYVFVPRAIGSVTRANVNGKFVRKQPEEKESKIVHIRYTKRDGSLVEFDRIFYVFKKELLHKFELAFEFRENIHGQKMLVTKKLLFETDHLSNQINTHAINMFCEIFNDFEIFTELLEPAIHFNKRFEVELLPKGKLSPDTIENVLEISKKYNKSSDHRAFQKRFHILLEYNPDLRGKGPSNFFGYLVFGFSDLGIVVLESMYARNATYVFKMKDYENNIIKNKQQALKSKQFLKRFVHYKNWENEMRRYLINLTK